MLLTIVFILIGLTVGFSVKMMFFRPDGARGVVAFFVASLFWLIAAPAIPAVMEIQFGKLGAVCFFSCNGCVPWCKKMMGTQKGGYARY